MKIIDIAKTDKVPAVTLDVNTKVFQIKGNCLPENIRSFSKQVIEKLEEHYTQLLADIEKTDDKDVFRVLFRLGYFNSAAAKFIADVMMLSKNYAEKGCNIKIYWYFDEDDHDMLEAGEDISKMVDVPMEFVAVVKE
jgi:hypothetical protein